MIVFLARHTLIRKWAACLLGALTGLHSFSLLACKYSVRDVAFVDLSRQTFEFITLAPSAEMDGLKSRIRPVATAVYLDSNVRMAWMPIEQASGHPAHDVFDQNPTAPAFCLYREGFQAFPMNPQKSLAELKDAELWAWLEHAVQSPTRQTLMTRLMDAYAVVLVVEGQDVDENKRAGQSAEKAAAFIAKLIPGMPKPVDVPPQVVTISLNQVQEEASLLWSLGMEWDSAEAPQAAVILGRGRRLGPVLKADEITATRLQEILAVAGQDCECDLDRSWMQGPMMPVRWGPDREQAAYKALEFDPENPLVKAEISRILARGKNAVPGGEVDTIGAELDMLLLGYSEEVIDFGDHVIESEATDNVSVSDQVAPDLVMSDEVPPTQESMDPQPDDSEGTTSAPATTVITTQAQGGVMRQIVVVLAGFCVLALLGGVGVLMFGRQRG